MLAASVDSQFSHLAWTKQPRKEGVWVVTAPHVTCAGGLGPMAIPILSDITHQIGKDYGVYVDEGGCTLRLHQHSFH